MSNSSLISYTNISPNRNSPRNHTIDTITIHCMAGQMTAKACADMFAKSSAQASANYCIGYDGKIALSVAEADRSWCSSSGANDHRAITIEVASDSTAPYAVKDAAYQSLLNLVTDICERNGIKELKWVADDKKYAGNPSVQNLTLHKWFAAKACPGAYLIGKMPEIAKTVNARLNPTTASIATYTVQCGAFSKKANADAYAKKIKAAGFDCYVTTKK